MDKRKRKLAKRKKKDTNRVSKLIANLYKDLDELAIGKTPPEVVDAQLEYYDKCSYTEQQLLMAIFKRNEDKQLTEISDFLAKK